MAVTHYRELIAWQKAVEMVCTIYKITSAFPAEERFGLTNQLRRAAVSIPSNIAEGQGRGVSRDFARYLRMANGSRQEVETQIAIAHRLGYLDQERTAAVLRDLEELGRIISGLLRSISETSA
jgi:four helix bundle protein